MKKTNQEKRLAEAVARTLGNVLVSESDPTLSGDQLAQRYENMYYSAGGYNLQDIYNTAMALRHWVSAAGYDRNGKFKVVMNPTIANC